MPIFQPRARPQILRQMIGRAVARSKLRGLERSSVVYHVLAAAADEDAEQYAQITNMRTLFDIFTASGSDLDDRAAEIQPAVIRRRRSTFATSDQTFVRATSTGDTLIPAGTIVGAGNIKFRTQANGIILDGNTQTAGVPTVAMSGGTGSNVVANTIVKIVTRIPGVTSTFNPSDIINGAGRESDEAFRARLVRHVQSLSKGTPASIEAGANDVLLLDGSAVLFAKVVEPLLPTGRFDVMIDDGTGTAEQFDESFLTSDDPILQPALGGATELKLSTRPIRDDGSFVFKIGGVVQERGADYELNAPRGILELYSPLSAGDLPTANYRFFTGLIQEVQKVIDGDPDSRLTHPGVRSTGAMATVIAAAAVFQTITANISVRSGFDPAAVSREVLTAIQLYINNLDIGKPVIVAELIERAMTVTGMYNFRISDLSGTFPAVDQNILSNQAARIVSSSISLS